MNMLEESFAAGFRPSNSFRRKFASMRDKPYCPTVVQHKILSGCCQFLPGQRPIQGSVPSAGGPERFRAAMTISEQIRTCTTAQVFVLKCHQPEPVICCFPSRTDSIKHEFPLFDLIFKMSGGTGMRFSHARNNNGTEQFTQQNSQISTSLALVIPVCMLALIYQKITEFSTIGPKF
jgi:hypothetical protein